MQKKISKVLVSLVCSLACASNLRAETGQVKELVPAEVKSDFPQDLTEIGLGELLKLDLVVTSPGRKEQRLSDVSSAVYVISAKDIEHSGVTHLAELLRGVPGVDIARVSSNKWAISIRGFNQLFAHRVLVLEDGVSVFSPTSNGVYWEAQDIPLDIVERIEVIRGPGAVLWGDNAVNGVINIITKKADQTQGSHAEVGGGTHEALTGLRYGGKIDDTTSYRLSARYVQDSSNERPTGESALDNWDSTYGGLRIDSQLNKRDSLLFIGDGQLQRENSFSDTPSLTPPYIDSEEFYDSSTTWRGAKSLLRWRREFDEHSDLEVRGSVLYKERNSKLISFDYQIYNLEVQHRLPLSDNNDLLYGGSYRFFRNASDGSYAQEVNPSVRETSLENAFVQDEIHLIPGLLTAVIGSKFEQNGHTGFEFMPNGRLIVTPTSETSIWAAVSRAVASPAIFFEDTRIPVQSFPLPDGSTGVATIVGNRSVQAESLLAYELGARSQITSDLFADLALFYNVYDNSFSYEQGEPYVGPYGRDQQPAVIIPINFGNRFTAHGYGAEMALSYNPLEWLRLNASYSFLQLEVALNGSEDIGGVQQLIEGGSPQNQASLRAGIRLASDVSWDSQFRYVDSLSYGNIPAYIDFDTRLAYQLTPKIQLSVVGQNLLHDSHVEFQGNLFQPPRTEMERAVLGVVTVNF